MTAVTTPTSTGSDRWAPFRAVLETQRADCVRQREAALAETVASLPDPVAVTRSATLLRTIEEIDAALERIAAGTYGVCVQCGTAVPEARLEFRPFAATCVSCQTPAR
ncbi:TraR/DksA family transcriptional regulator [Blastococcus sp. SYSU D00813]